MDSNSPTPDGKEREEEMQEETQVETQKETPETDNVDEINVAQEERELTSALAGKMKNAPPKTPTKVDLFADYNAGSGKAKLDLLPFELQKETIDMYLGTGGRTKTSAHAITKHLKKLGVSIDAKNVQKWLEKRSASLYRDMITEENEKVISGSYAELLTNFTEANRIMMEELRSLSQITATRGKVQDMKYCFDALQNGLTELRSHMENSKTSDYRSTKKLIDEMSEEAQDLGITDLKPTTQETADINKP